MKQTCILFLLFCASFMSAQIADFEDINLAPESFLNGSDGSGGFYSGLIWLPNDYNTSWQSWSGWAISNTTNVTTPGPVNQYSAITGEGAQSSSNYAVAFVVGKNKMHLPDIAFGDQVVSLSITNSTYAYWSMKNGDMFTKKFGGLTGNDPDYFLLTIKAYKEGLLSPDSIDFYLADYRFADNTQDYIIDEWTNIDLSSLENHDSLSFTLSSSDNSTFGMNTPAYFCIDNVVATKLISARELSTEKTFEVFPNPTASILFLKNIQDSEVLCSIFNMTGQLVYNNLTTSAEKIDLRHLASGTYVVKVQDGEQISVQMLVKQ